MATINKTWFKNRLKKGELLVKCNGKYSDDYAFDNAYGFFKDKEFETASPEDFSDWYIGRSHISGEKNSIIELSFASCEFYSFKLKTA